LTVIGLLVAAVVCAASALPALYFLRPELFVDPPRGATKALIDRTTKRSTYQPHPSRGRSAEEKGKEGEGEGEKEEEEEGACAICLSEYEAGEEVRELGCGHVFHASCAEAWLLTNKTCAACRRPIDTD
jgi:hypothetical protein